LKAQARGPLSQLEPYSIKRFLGNFLKENNEGFTQMITGSWGFELKVD
jgi:hypothetical protein